MFDVLCHEVVTILKEKYPSISSVFCLTNERHLNPHKRPKFLNDEDYEEFIYLPLTFDYWYTRIYYRNCEMINRSDFILFYCTNRQGSGAYKALKYAQKCKKAFVNLYE